MSYTIRSDIPQSWFAAIHASANTWTNVEPSHFVLFYSTGSSNEIYRDYLEAGYVARTYTGDDPTTIPGARTIFDEDSPFDPNLPPAANMYSVQNIMTHEFGHWIRLLDQDDGVCSAVTMYHQVYRGETQKIDLTQHDINGLNWQYPY